jgi:hypothetical protein
MVNAICLALNKGKESSRILDTSDNQLTGGNHMNADRASLVAGFLAAVAAAFAAGAWAQQKASSWPYPTSLDAVAASPQNHKVLYENEDIRFLEVTVRPGEKENLHAHQWSSVFIVDRVQPALTNYTAAGKAAVPRSPTDASYPLIRRMGPQPPHQVENLDTYAQHFYRVEFKKMQFTGQGTPGVMYPPESVN